MRTDIVHLGADELTCEIRNVVNVGIKLQELGLSTNWENIGDPISKGEEIPEWMKEIVTDAVMKDSTYGYCPTKGVLSTREFIANQTNMRGGVQIKPEDIIFFNGLGDAISKVFEFLKKTARVLVPSPSYSTHSSAEAAHARDKPLTYTLDPDNQWYPDLDELEKSIIYNPAVAGILIINPSNPTGAVYPTHILEAMVDIANRYDLFLICDEVYHHIVYNGISTSPLSDVIGEVPAIVMRGVSKEMPWPGSRCGWIEIYNGARDPMFAKYINSIFNAKMVEVCSTTLPQSVYPTVIQHPEYQGYLEERIRRYEKFSNIATETLKGLNGLLVNRPNGAFYMSVCFENGILTKGQTLPIENNEIQEIVENLVRQEGMALDKRFVYYLLASTGICVVPLTSFATDLLGFRMTLLERDEAVFRKVFKTTTIAIKQYLESDK